jgi:N-dimethylarginine dimethylaminohydrolase
MCRPTYFDVVYSINPWMDPRKPVDTALAVAQWERLRQVYLDLGHTVELIDPVRGLPDMVFAANGATVVDGRALVARFRDAERVDEAPAYREWLQGHGFTDLRTAELVNEGEGDYLLVGDLLLAGTGFRSDPRSHGEAQEFFGRPVIGLTLVDPHFYHLDTALTVLDEETIAYYPPAFSPGSRAVLERLFPDAVIAGDATSASTPPPTASTSSCRTTRPASSSSCATADSVRPGWTCRNS